MKGVLDSVSISDYVKALILIKILYHLGVIYSETYNVILEKYGDGENGE